MKSFFPLLGSIAIYVASLLPLTAYAEDLQPVPTTPYLKVNILAFRNYRAADRKKADQALALLERVINSDEFKRAVLDYQWNGKPQFADNNGLRNEEILQMIYEGRELLTQEANNAIDLDLTLKRMRQSILGYTYPDTLRIWTNSRFFRSAPPASIAGNFAHEWCHKIGFGHDFYWTQKRDYSVPYAIGYLVEKLAQSFSQ